MQVIAADSVRRVLASVLSSGEFASRRGSLLLDLIGKAFRWIWGWLARVVAWLFRDVDTHAPGLDIAERLVVLAVAGIGVWLLVRLARMGLSAVRGTSPPGRGSTEAGRVRVRSAEEWEALAREAGSAARWREASLALYHAVVLRLAEAGRVRPSAAKTPGDYRREVARAPLASGTQDLAERVAAFLRAFERVAFAGTPPHAADYQRLRELAEPMGAHG